MMTTIHQALQAAATCKPCDGGGTAFMLPSVLYRVCVLLAAPSG
jgi:hypothetical protein